MIYLLPGPARRSPLSTSATVAAFVSSLIAESGGRAAQHFGTEVVSLPPDSWQTFLETNAAQRNIQMVATAFIPTGPVRDLVRADWPDTLVLNEIVRPYDRAVWPHAIAGFFRLRKAIPGLLPRRVQTD